MKTSTHSTITLLGALLLLASIPLQMFGTPTMTLNSPTASTSTVGSETTVQGTASDSAGLITEHWLEVKRPAGDWSWEGWLQVEPWGPFNNHTPSSSTKSTNFRFDTPGTYVFRTTAYVAATDTWYLSSEKTVTVSNISGAPQVTLSSPNNISNARAGSSITVTGAATDSDGTMSEHWLEVKRPAGDWSWEGWLTSEPWGPNINGSSYSSTKSTSFTLSDYGIYTFRTTAYDPATSNWTISNELKVSTAAPRFVVFVQTVGSDVTVSAYAYGSDITALGGYALQGGTTVNLPSGGYGQGSYMATLGRYTTSTWPTGTYEVHLTVTDSTGSYEVIAYFTSGVTYYHIG